MRDYGDDDGADAFWWCVTWGFWLVAISGWCCLAWCVARPYL